MSYSVAQSKRDSGLRVALGADGPDLLRLVIRQGLLLTMGGVFVGGAVALASTRLPAYLSYQGSPRNPATLAFAFIVMIFILATACLLPARRAVLTDLLKTALYDKGEQENMSKLDDTPYRDALKKFQRQIVADGRTKGFDAERTWQSCRLALTEGSGIQLYVSGSRIGLCPECCRLACSMLV